MKKNGLPTSQRESRDGRGVAPHVLHPPRASYPRASNAARASHPPHRALDTPPPSGDASRLVREK